MINITNKERKEASIDANEVLHDWDRDSELEAIEQLIKAEDVQTLGELFALHRVTHEFKERKGMKEEKADHHFLSQSVH